MNKRMAYANSGATLATAVALDQVPAEKFDKAKAEIVKVCTQLNKFLDDGMIADLPVDIAKEALETFMLENGWQSYISLVDIVFAWVDTQHVDTGKIGINNIIVIKEGLYGIQQQALRAKSEWASPFGTEKVDTTRGVGMKIE